MTFFTLYDVTPATLRTLLKYKHLVRWWGYDRKRHWIALETDTIRGKVVRDEIMLATGCKASELIPVLKLSENLTQHYWNGKVVSSAEYRVHSAKSRLPSMPVKAA